MHRRQVKCTDCGFLAVAGGFERIFSLTELKEMGMDTLKEIGLIGDTECHKEGRNRVADYTHAAPESLNCVRRACSRLDHKGKEKSDILDILNSRRQCPYFFPYSPGYSPIEHKELQREAQSRRVLLIGMLLSATIGATAAIVAQLLTT